VDDDDPPRHRPVRFLDELVEFVQVAGEQDDRAFQLKRRGSHDSIDGTPMTGKPGRSEQLASAPRWRVGYLFEACSIPRPDHDPSVQ
jgi:hypothetical protein